MNAGVRGPDSEDNGVLVTVIAYNSVFLEHRDESRKPAVTYMETCTNYIRAL